MNKLFALLDKLPFNGFKTAIGVGLYVATVGLWGTGQIDEDTALMAITLISTWTGVSFAHKVHKANQ